MFSHVFLCFSLILPVFRAFLYVFPLILPVFPSLGTLRSDNGDGNGNGNGNVRSLGRAGPRRVGVPAKIEITNFTSENVDDGH